MHLTDTIFSLIDMRSFSNLWYWIALAVAWSSASHRVMGVPWDMVQRARRVGGEAEADFEALVRINLNRILYIGEVAGMMLVAIVCFLLTCLGVLGFAFGQEFCQALVLILFPMSLRGLFALQTARRLDRLGLKGEPLRRALALHRLGVQALGLVSIFVTAMWGMMVNMNVHLLGV